MQMYVFMWPIKRLLYHDDNDDEDDELMIMAIITMKSDDLVT